MYKHALIIVAEGARVDLTKQLLENGELPNIQEHIVDRGCFRTALSVFPSATGPTHVPIFTGLHPGTANVPGCRWLCRRTHDTRRRSIYRHRSLNGIGGLMAGRDVDAEKSTSLFEYFERPSSVMELIDFRPGRPLFKVVAGRLQRMACARRTGDREGVDRTVEQLIIRRIKAGSDCITGCFFGIDKNSHAYGPLSGHTVAAYKSVDRAVGNIASVLQKRGSYDQTIIAVVSDHGLSSTTAHVPLVDIVKDHGFRPYHYPGLYRRDRDSAVMESGNAMAALYFKRGERWGDHWRYDEMQKDPRISRLITALRNTQGVSFVCSRLDGDGVIFAGREGDLRAVRREGSFEITVQGVNPLADQPAGEFTSEQLFVQTHRAIYPDAINQLFFHFASRRSGDLVVNCEPDYNLRQKHENPEHRISHGSLHREHILVPLMFSVPLERDVVRSCDLVPTILELTGKTPTKPLDGRSLVAKQPPVQSRSADSVPAPGRNEASEEPCPGEEPEKEQQERGGFASILTTAGIIVMGIILAAIFKEDILRFGEHLMTTYGKTWVDGILFLLTAVSCTPLTLPIWIYTLAGIALGYHVLRLAAIMALGSATGSYVTFLLGRYFGNSDWIKRRFPNIHRHPWTHGKSRLYVTLVLFLGTASPIPCDIIYVACGAKRYPALLFWVTMIAARFVRYCYLGYGFLYFREFFDYFT